MSSLDEFQGTGRAVLPVALERPRRLRVCARVGVPHSASRRQRKHWKTRMRQEDKNARIRPNREAQKTQGEGGRQARRAALEELDMEVFVI